MADCCATLSEDKRSLEKRALDLMAGGICKLMESRAQELNSKLNLEPLPEPNYENVDSFFGDVKTVFLREELYAKNDPIYKMFLDEMNSLRNKLKDYSRVL